MTTPHAADPAPADRAFAVIGCGRTGSTVAASLLAAGYRLTALTCRTAASSARAAEFLRLPLPAEPDTNGTAAASAPLVLIGTPDASIAAVAGALAAQLETAGHDPTGRVFLHLSGALDHSILAPLAAIGAATGTLHPLQTFPRPIRQPDYLAGITFGIDGDPAAAATAEELVRAIGGRPLRIAAGAKSAYHAAASVASNHTTAVLDLALRLLAEAGLHDRAQAMAALLPLVLTTLAAIESSGPEQALTGPIVRGDAATVGRHLAILRGPDHRFYLDLARATLALARRSERLEADLEMAAALRNRPTAIVASIGGDDGRGMANLARAATAADWLELRLDRMADPTALEDALAAARSTVSLARTIVTCRPNEAVDPPAAARLLRQALAAGVGLVDSELPAHDDRAHDDLAADRLVLSWHGPAAAGLDAARRIASVRPAVGKVVIAADSVADLLLIPPIAAVLRGGCGRVAALAMGQAGQASRILAARLGSDWTYACVQAGQETAPGQLPLDRLVSELRCRAVGAGTAVFGLAGDPIDHSLSPRIMNRLLPEALGDVVYVPLPATTAEPIVRLMRELPLDGLSVTMPLKEAMADAVDDLSESARATRSVNTVLRRGDRLIGHNTDIAGIVAVAASLLDLKDADVLVLGAGGAARAAAFGLAQAGARVAIAARRQAAASAAAEVIRAAVTAVPAVPEVIAGAIDAVPWPPDGPWDLLVNATPAGMAGVTPAMPPIPTCQPGVAVLDLVYAPGTTPLIDWATARGLRTASGVDVLLAQAAHQIELFSGWRPPPHRLRQAAL